MVLAWVWSAVGLACLGAGVAVLRAAWLRRQRLHRLLWTGWALLLAGFVAFLVAWGAELGSAFAALALALLAYGAVIVGVQRRTARTRTPRDVALEPEEHPSNLGRAVFKALLSVVIAGLAAMGLGLAIATRAPLLNVDRVVIGSLLVPFLWAAGMAWALYDARLVRVFLLLLGISAIAYGAVFLPTLVV